MLEIISIRVRRELSMVIIRVCAAGLSLVGASCVQRDFSSPEISAEVAELRRKVEYLSDRQQILEVYRRLNRGVDRHDVALQRSAFWPDAQINYGLHSFSLDGFSQWANANHELGSVSHQHHITNQSVDVSGAVAHVESYAIIFLRSKDEKSTVVGGVRYADRLDRREGEWRIVVREFVPDILFSANSVYQGAFQKTYCPPSGCGTWDTSDPSYRRPLDPRPR